MAQRVTEISRIRLEGAKFADVLEYVREAEQNPESCWYEESGQEPLEPHGDSTIWRYISQADDAIEAEIVSSRKKLFKKHLAQREHLYSKATLAGDFRTSLSILKDIDELMGLYPAQRKTKPTEQPNEQPLTESERNTRIFEFLAALVGKSQSPPATPT
jgi:hypothetical protein